MAKPPKPRWFIDADTLGLAHALVRARSDVTYVGDDGKRHNKRWEMERKAENPGPFIYSVTRSSISEVDLTSSV